MIIKLQQADLLLRLEVKNLIEKLIRYSYFVYYIVYKINNLKVLFLRLHHYKCHNEHKGLNFRSLGFISATCFSQMIKKRRNLIKITFIVKL